MHATKCRWNNILCIFPGSCCSISSIILMNIFPVITLLCHADSEMLMMMTMTKRYASLAGGVLIGFYRGRGSTKGLRRLAVRRSRVGGRWAGLSAQRQWSAFKRSFLYIDLNTQFISTASLWWLSFFFFVLLRLRYRSFPRAFSTSSKV